MATNLGLLSGSLSGDLSRVNAYYDGVLAGLQSDLRNLPLEEAKREVESRRAEASFALKEKYDRKGI